MKSGVGYTETEVKIRLGSLEEGLEKLKSAGLEVRKARIFEANAMYDLPGGVLKSQGKALRLRRAGDVVILTLKGKAAGGVYKSRPEVETPIADAAAGDAILQGLGYQVVFRYEKYRTEFGREGEAGVVTLDETPIGTFLEVEGEPGWIDHVANELGFTVASYLTGSYGRLYLEHCRRCGDAPQDMVFRSSGL